MDAFYSGEVPEAAKMVRLYRITPKEALLACEAIDFAGGAQAIRTTLNRAAISGRVAVAGEVVDHFADLLDASGSMVETVALDRRSYAALKNRWMKTRLDRALNAP